MLETGSVIDGKYKILNVIGKGGMSVVYLAMNEKANKQWAIKEITRADYRDFEIDRREIEMMKRLKHPHLPSVVDVIEEEHKLLIVMDYIEGLSLENRLAEQGAQPQETVIAWAKQLCDVLSYLHAQNPPIIYRDMKPANVMLRPDSEKEEGHLMLIDFGAAREYRPQNPGDTISLGTRGYAAPEQYGETGQSDARTDIYCLGVMLFQLLTGNPPHELGPIRDSRPELSSGLEAIIEKCTQPRKEDRYQSCGELMYALEHYWEYDADYRRQQKRNLVKFLIPAVLTMIFGISGVVFGTLEYRIQEHSYDAYLLAARNSISREEETENYRKAVNLNPYRETAYLELLSNVYLDDNVLTTEESEELRATLIAYGNGKQTNEREFQKNEKGYAQFSYQAGIAYFYKFEEKSNKKNAKGYFEIASHSEYLEENQLERSRRLCVIADYYARIGKVDEAGDVVVTYRDYWTDLTGLADGNLVEMDNERTALVVYGELVTQLASRAAEFGKAGVEKEEMLAQLEHIRLHLDSDFVNISEENRTMLEQELKELSGNIEKAERMVESACREAEREGK